MPASDRDTEGRRLVGHGVIASLHVPRRGARRSGTAGRVPQDGADASGSRVGRCEQRRCQNSSSLVLRREQWQCAGKYEFQLSRYRFKFGHCNWTLDFSGLTGDTAQSLARQRQRRVERERSEPTTREET